MTTILVVDRSELWRTAVTQFLTSSGYHVLGVGDARTALAQVHAARPDLIVVDLLLPILRGSGVELIRQLKADPGTAPIPIISWTNDPALTAGEQSAAIGSNRHRVKALTPSLLTDIQVLLGVQVRPAPRHATGPLVASL